MRTITLIALAILAGCRGQQSKYMKDIAEHRADLHREFRDPKTSPLVPEDLSSFRGLHFFAIDSNYKVIATLERLPGTDTFEMAATGERTRNYVTYAIAHFDLAGQKAQLSLFQQVGTGVDYMFIPFKDLTCGEDSYGGGRFMDVSVPSSGSLIIDFNLAYNPYCAYNPKYSCPIPPPDNHLAFRVEAGEKDYAHP